MLKDLADDGSVGRIFFEHSQDQVFALRAHRLPDGMHERRLLMSDVRGDLFQGGPLKRHSRADQGEEDGAETPDVDSGVAAFFEDSLRGHVAGRARVAYDRFAWRQLCRQAEVANFDLGTFTCL